MSSPTVQIALFALIAAAVIGPQACCQAQPAAGVLSFTDTEVSEALAQIEEHFGARIVSDGKLDNKVTATLRDPDITQALTSVTSPFGYKWRKVTLACGKDEEISGGKLRGIVAALERLDDAGVVVDNPIEGTKLAFRRNPDDSSDLEGEALPTGEVYKTYYFVYSARPKITFAPAAQLTTAPTPGQAARGPYGQMSAEGLTDWFSQLDREAQSELLGELIGSMMGGGPGEVGIWFDSGDKESGVGKIVIRQGESGGGDK